MTMTIKDEGVWREEIVRVTRQCTAQGLIRSSDGNLSVRLAPDRYLITPSGIYKATLQPADLLLIDAEANVIAGPSGLRPTSETRLHLEVYNRRPDVRAVLHAHPPYATALTLIGVTLPVNLIPEVLLTLGDVPTAPYATPGTAELAASIRPYIATHDALLLSHHGSLTIGPDLETALIALERIEHTARIYALAHALGTPQPLPAAEVARLRRLGQ